MCISWDVPIFIKITKAGSVCQDTSLIRRVWDLHWSKFQHLSFGNGGLNTWHRAILHPLVSFPCVIKIFESLKTCLDCLFIRENIILANWLTGALVCNVVFQPTKLITSLFFMTTSSSFFLVHWLVFFSFFFSCELFVIACNKTVVHT